MQRKLHSLLIYWVLWTLSLQDTSRLVSFFFQNCILFLSTLKMENSKKIRGKKSQAWSNLELLAKLSLVFHCFSLLLLWFFIGSHWFFLGLFIDFSLVLNDFHVLFFAYQCFCSLVFIVFSGVFLWCLCSFFAGVHMSFNDFMGFPLAFFIVHSCFFVFCFNVFHYFSWVFIGVH